MRIFPRRRDALIFLIFLILSGLFWLSTALNGYYDYEVDVPVVMTNVPTSLVPMAEDVDMVRVMVHDKGFALLPYVRGNSMSPLQVDYSTYKTNSNKCIISTSELHKLLAKKFTSSTTINSIKPDKIEQSFIEGVAKRVPVRLVGNLVPAQSYYLEHSEISPSQVTVYASPKEIDSITSVETERIELKDFSDTVRNKVALQARPNTKVVPHEVTITLYPDILTEEEIDVPVTTVNVPQGITLRTFPSRVTVRFVVGASMYRTIDVSQFKVEVDYDEIGDQAEKCCIALTEIPKGVKTATLSVDEVDYLIEN